VRDKSGVIRVAGGKLTTYRAMAAQIVDHVERAMRRRMSQTHTADGLLPGADRSEIVKAMETENSEFAAPMIPGLRYTRAEAVYTMRRELAVTIGDILIRRTRAAFETRDNARSAAPIVADLMARELGWSDQLKQRELERYEREIQRIFSVRE
jgi:glycerol-3-phosphate dehydrogenase